MRGRHPDVGDDDIRLVKRGEDEERVCISDGSQDLVACLLEDPDEPLRSSAESSASTIRRERRPPGEMQRKVARPRTGIIQDQPSLCEPRMIRDRRYPAAPA